jgi:hypothetical protein
MIMSLKTEFAATFGQLELSISRQFKPSGTAIAWIRIDKTLILALRRFFLPYERGLIKISGN